MQDVLDQWSEEAETRCRSLVGRPFADRMVQAARDEVITWRWSESESRAHRPEPFAAQRSGRGEWRDEPPAEYSSADRVGFDAAGRPVLVVSWYSGKETRVVEVWEHTDDRSVGLWRLDDTQGLPPRASVTILDDLNRPALVASATMGWSTIDGVRQVEVAREQWTWSGDRVARGEIWPASAAASWQGSSSGTFIVLMEGDDDDEADATPAVVEPEYDAAGELVQLSIDGRPLLGDPAEGWFDALFPEASGAVDLVGGAVDSDRSASDRYAPGSPATTDRAELTAALLAAGVQDAAAIVRDHAVAAVRLVPADGSDGGPCPRTRLYGRRGLLPPGETWPHARNGRALGFLAAIDLSELPRDLLGVASPLPPAGWLLFFADTDTDVAADGSNEWEQGTFLGEGYPNLEGEPSRVLWVPPSEDPVEADPPPLRAAATAHEERRCKAVAQLQLPTGWALHDTLELPREQHEGYREVADTLSGWGADFVLGIARGAQGEGTEPGEAVLLHLGSAEFQDGGTIQFRLLDEALASGDWSRIEGHGDSN